MTESQIYTGILFFIFIFVKNKITAPLHVIICYISAVAQQEIGIKLIKISEFLFSGL